MPFIFRFLRLNWLLSLTAMILMLSVTPAHAQFYDLEINVGDTTGYPGQQNSVISIYMKNWSDTVAGFELWLMLDNPEIMEFQIDSVILYDTAYWRCTTWSGSICLDSMDVTDSVLTETLGIVEYDWIVVTDYEAVVGNHDTSGTLTSGWEFVSSRSLTGLGHDLKIVAQANYFPPPYTPGVGYPQTGEIPLIKILADIYPIPDSAQEREVTIFVQADNLDNFSFSDQDGNGIGVITDTVLDTSWFVCDSWEDSICLFYHEVPNGPIDSVDSFYCCDTILTGHLDTDKVRILNGTLTVLSGVCGDVDGNQSINLLDITYLISYLYKGGPPPPSPNLADVNSTGSINLLDITYLINYLYKGGPSPFCP